MNHLAPQAPFRHKTVAPVFMGGVKQPRQPQQHRSVAHTAPVRAATPPPNRWPASTRALAISTPEVVTSMPLSPGEAETLQRAVHDLMLERVCFGSYSAAANVASAQSGGLGGHPATANGLLMAIRSGVPAARQLLEALNEALASCLRSVHMDIRGSKAFTRFAWLVGFRDAASGSPWSGGFEEVMRNSHAIAKGTQTAAIDFARRVSASLMAAGDPSGADLYNQSAHVLSLNLIPALGGLAVALIHRPNARAPVKPEWGPLLNEIQRRAHQQRSMAVASAHQQASAAAAAQFRAHPAMAAQEAAAVPHAASTQAAGMPGPRVVMPVRVSMPAAVPGRPVPTQGQAVQTSQVHAAQQEQPRVQKRPREEGVGQVPAAPSAPPAPAAPAAQTPAPEAAAPPQPASAPSGPDEVVELE